MPLSHKSIRSYPYQMIFELNHFRASMVKKQTLDMQAQQPSE